jgi:putative FmdB family regulatory protein
MPIYEYECQKCGRRFDVMQSFNDAPLKTCEGNDCRGRVRKVISPPAIIFKGSGFHVNDYGRNGKRSDSAPKKDGVEKAKEAAESTAPAAPAKSETPSPQ